MKLLYRFGSHGYARPRNPRPEVSKPETPESQ